MVAKLENEEKILSSVLRMNIKFVALALGLILGLVVFIATNWLLIKGGHTSPSGEYVVGPLGSIIGFLYGFAVGTLAGSAIGLIYNKIVDLRN
jgi:hypothetical protein